MGYVSRPTSVNIPPGVHGLTSATASADKWFWLQNYRRKGSICDALCKNSLILGENKAAF